MSSMFSIPVELSIFGTIVIDLGNLSIYSERSFLDSTLEIAKYSTLV